jgi:hypothetical protein
VPSFLLNWHASPLVADVGCPGGAISKQRVSLGEASWSRKAYICQFWPRYTPVRSGTYVTVDAASVWLLPQPSVRSSEATPAAHASVLGRRMDMMDMMVILGMGYVDGN